MKFIILFSAVFLLSSCGKNQAKSSLEEATANGKPVKYSFIVMTENTVPKCLSSLEGREDLVPPFAEAYPVGHPVYSKRLVSSTEVEGMTEEEKQGVHIVPAVLADLPNCGIEEQASVAQLVPETALIPSSEEEVAGLGAVMKFLGLNTLGCVSGFIGTWSLKTWYTYGAHPGNVIPAFISGLATTAIVWPTPPTRVFYGLGALACGSLATPTGFTLFSDFVDGTSVGEWVDSFGRGLCLEPQASPDLCAPAYYRDSQNTDTSQAQDREDLTEPDLTSVNLHSPKSE